jgi:hypothetical protein
MNSAPGAVCGEDIIFDLAEKSSVKCASVFLTRVLSGDIRERLLVVLETLGFDADRPDLSLSKRMIMLVLLEGRYFRYSFV